MSKTSYYRPASPLLSYERLWPQGYFDLAAGGVILGGLQPQAGCGGAGRKPLARPAARNRNNRNINRNRNNGVRVVVGGPCLSGPLRPPEMRRGYGFAAEDQEVARPRPGCAGWLSATGQANNNRPAPYG